jgi:hypothetical protein
MQSAIQWLLRGDPSIRWQVQRDLLDVPPEEYARERARIAYAGWGRRLLAKQQADGNWGGGIYSPKWISTTYTLLLLRDMGLDQENSQAQRACENFFFRGIERDGGVNLFRTIDYSEQCVNGMLLGILSYFRCADERVARVADFLLRQQMPDGGWNCRSVHGATHSSFHTTISVLEGLREYRAFTAKYTTRVDRAIARGVEFLVLHRLYRSHRTGRIVDASMTRFHFPPRWHYDILRALDYFRSMDVASDSHMAEAIALVESRQAANGRWTLNNAWAGRIFFELEEVGKPSRWNTLRALRVLRWWRGGKPTGSITIPAPI